VCNPSPMHNIHGDRMLTQLDLQRLPVQSSAYVDEFLREVTRRLLGGSYELEVRIHLSTPQQAQAWVHAATYLEGRMQSTAEQKPGRERDMGPAAADAMFAVMSELSESCAAWLSLRSLLDKSDIGSDPEGGVADFPSAAREEAARKLISNQSMVRIDICNPFHNTSIKGNKLTQARSLIRLPYEDSPHVDMFLREVARRLLGRRAGAKRLEVRLDPSNPPQARAWVAAARYFSQRIQSTPQQSPGREPDMGPDAAAALQAVMADLSAMSAALLKDMEARGLVATDVKPKAAWGAGTAPKAVRPVVATKEAALAKAAAPSAATPVPKALAPAGAAFDKHAASAAMRHLCASKESGFQKWIASKNSATLLDSWNHMLLESLQSPEAIRACARRHFGPYTIPDDMAGWLLGISVLAESLPLAFVLSDAQTAGFPLIFINNKFTDVTGYTKEDCYGRNCRFLQGPATNPEHGKQLLDTLRNGQDSQIMMVNYRKSGEVFENLLTMAYVRDAHGRRRYCVGLQLDLTGLETDDGPWGQEALSTDEGRELIEATRKKYAMLIKLLPQTLPVPTPPQPVSNREATACIDGRWHCPQLEALAAALGSGMPETDGTNWVAVLYAILDQTPHAVLAVDMSVPGLPLDFINPGFTSLTEWPVEEAVGKNCRFLQDERTEPLALSQLITAIRTYQPLSLQITNVKRGGASFVNDLSVHPIFDTNGTCRFMIAVQADAANAAAETPSLSLLRRHIPQTPVDTALFPKTPPKFEPVPTVEQWKEWQKVNTKLIRLLWATEPDGALRQLLAMHPAMAQQAMQALLEYFGKNNRQEDEAILSKLIEHQRAGTWSALAGRKSGISSNVK